MIKKATLAYLCEIYINENVWPISYIQAKLAWIARIQSSLKIEYAYWAWMVGGGRYPVLKMGEVWFWAFLKFSLGGLFFPLCGKLVRHLPVCGWLHAVVGVIKCRENSVISGWDDRMSDTLLIQMITESVESTQGPPSRVGHQQKKWTYVLTPVHWRESYWREVGPMLEDVCWLCLVNDAQHINLAELDAIVKEVKLALQWQAKRLHLRINSLCVYHADWKSRYTYQGSKQDTDKMETS